MDRQPENLAPPPDMENPTKQSTHPITPKRSIAARLFGYDIFLSFALGSLPRGTQSYASELARQLRDRDFTVFFCEVEAPAGEELDSALLAALNKSKMLVVISNRGALENPRKIREEVERYRKLRPNRRIIPVNVAEVDKDQITVQGLPINKDGTLQDTELAKEVQEWLQFIGKIWVNETNVKAVENGIASEAVVDGLAQSVSRIKSNTVWRWFVGAVVTILMVLALGLGVATQRANTSEKEAVDQRDEAVKNKILAVANMNLAKAKEEETRMAELRVRKELLVSTSARLANQNQSILSGRRTGGTELAMLQLLAAHRLLVTAETENNLLAILMQNRNLDSIMRIAVPGEILAATSDGSRVVYLSDSNILHLWDVGKKQNIGNPLKGVVAHTPIAFSPNGAMIASFGVFSNLLRWDANTAQPIKLDGAPDTQALINVQSIAFSGNGNRIAAGDVGGGLMLWDAKTGRPIGTPFRAHILPVTSLALNSDGSYVASASKGDGPDDESLYLWDMRTNQPNRKALLGHHFGVLSVAFSQDGKRLASSGNDNSLIQWEVSTGKMIDKPLNGLGGVTNIAFNPNSNGYEIVASYNDADGSIGVWNRYREKKQNSYSEAATVFQGHLQGINNIAFSADSNQIIALSGDANLRRWNANGDVTVGQQLDRCKFNSAIVAPIVGFSADDKHAIAAIGTVTSCVWNAQTGTMEKTTQQESGNMIAAEQAFIRDGRIVTHKQGKNALLLWDVLTGMPNTLQSTLGDREANVIAISRDGTRFVTSDWNHPHVSKSTGKDLRLWNANTGQLMGGVLHGHEAVVTAAAFSADGRHVVSGDKNGAVILHPITGLSPDISLKGQTNEITCITFSSDGSRVAAGNKNGKLVAWDISARRIIGRGLQMPNKWQGKSESLTSVAFDNDGHHIVTGFYHGAVRLWDIEAGLPIDTPLTWHNDPVTSVAFSNDGKRIVSSSERGVMIWHAPAVWADDLCKKLTRNMTHSEWGEWVTKEIDYKVQCPGLPIPPDEFLTASKGKL